MSEEPETKELPVDPCMDPFRPTLGRSQDISHVLESVFQHLYIKDITEKDILSNFLKTKTGQSSYDDRCVEDIQQAHAEYSRCIKEADMLENQLIQARARAADTEVSVSWCEEELLKMHSLLFPQDNLPTHEPRVKAQAAIKPNPGRPTIAYAMRMSRKSEMNESDLNLKSESSSDTSETKKTPKETKPRPKWKDEPSAKDRKEGLEQLQRLKDPQSFLRNPRFPPSNAQQGGTSLIRPRAKAGKTEHVKKGTEEYSSTDDVVPVFLAKPPAVVFTDYSVGQIFETTLELQNVSSASRTVRVIPPTTPYFCIGLGRFPGEGGVVAPGLSCKYAVRFAPDSLGDYEDFIVVETQADHLLVVPIAAKRPPPVLTLPRVLDCGPCLIGGVKFVEFECQNAGFSSGTFCIMPKNQWPASNLRSVATTVFSEQPPFTISPTLFVLQPGEATVVEVVFSPTTAEKSRQVFTVVCDNCQVKDISIEGEGQAIALELVSVSGKKEPPVIGEFHDLTAEHFVRFSPCNPHSVQQKKVVIRSNVHLELPFHWRITKPNLHPLLPGETPEPSYIQSHLATDDAFQISPSTGVLPPCQEQEFLFTFCPKELRDYHSVCHLVLGDDPELPPEARGDSVLQPVHTGSKVSDATIMRIEIKGSTEPYQVLLEPYAVIIPGKIFICTTTRRQFKMWNHSKTCIFFQWERRSSSSHTIEVAPSAGKIEKNECFDFDLILNGEKPERVVTSVVCHVQHHHKPVCLPVEVSFKGPTVTLSVPSVEFGLMRLGEQRQTKLQLTNITNVEACWMLMECHNSQQDSQISVEPCRGVLPPLACRTVDVLFSPRFCQHYETELALTVENGTGCHVLVRADVQSPQVCLLKCKLLLSDLYVGVPAKATVTLFNETLLPSHFSWMAQLQGKQAKLCTASFDPSSGILGPNASLEITVSFIAHTDLELTEVFALCEVQGMNSPLVVSIVTSRAKKLSVAYSLPSVRSTTDNENASTLLLDFGDDVILKRAVTKQLLITNQTAIPAPFTVEVEYFTCHASKPDNQSEERFTYVRKPLHYFEAEKIKQKEHEEFVSSLLAHGKGAAFFVQPDAGTLGPFETQTVDVTAYTDMWGEYRDHLICKVGDLEPTLIPMQMTVTGCPIYFHMTGPRPDNQNQGPAIQFGAHVSGGDTVSRSVRINNPTMFDIRMDWETYNIDRNDRKLVDLVVTYGDAFPVKDADGNEISGGNLQTAQEGNGTPSSEGTSDSLRSVTDGHKEEHVSEDDCKEEKTCLYLSPTKKNAISVHIRPHVGNLSDYPYCITPQQIVIPAKSSSTIHVSFTPLTLSESARESKCVGLARGFMSLDSEMAACVPGKVRRAQGLDLEPVRMDLLAVVKPAVLLVQMEEDEGVLEFHASAGDLLRAQSQELRVHEFDITRSLQLRNNLEMPLHFRLGTPTPFLVVKPQPRVRTSTSSNPPIGDGQPLVLQPRHSVRVKMAFHCSLSLLDHADQADEEVPPGVTLIHGAKGERKLRFQQNLLIHHSNNTLQTVPLCAHLDLPTMYLTSDSISFGFCYVGQTQIREVNLYSQGAHTYWKLAIESDEGDSHVFRVTPDFGLLKSKEIRVSRYSQCLQISFTPSKDREFRATVVIQSPLVKTPVTLQLQGAGSFDEGYRSN